MTIKLCQWDITGSCNLNCTYCREKSTSGFQRLELSQLFHLIDQMAEMKVEMLMIAGGEPFTLKELPIILEYAAKKLPHVGISSNGTLINESHVGYLREFCYGIQVSLDGSCAEIHDTFRGKGNFDRAVQGINLLRKHEINVMTRLTICHENLHDVGNYIRFVHSLGLKSAYLRRVIPSGNSSNYHALTSDMLHEAFRTAFSVGRELGMHIGSADYFSQIEFDPNERAKVEKNLVERPGQLLSGCSIGINAFYLAQDGRILFCPYLPVECGDMLTEGLEYIWKNSKMFKINRSLRKNIKGKCSTCRFKMCCGGCPAYTFRTTGDITQSDNGCWINEQGV